MVAMDEHGSSLTSGVDLARLVEICERYGVAELSVFGSVARDDLPAMLLSVRSVRDVLSD